MKQAIVQTITQGGNEYGQVSNPNDLMKAQDFVHGRVTSITKDFLNGTSDPDIKGFAFTLGSGNAFNMTVHTPGRIYASDGVSYDLLGNATVTFDAAHATLPRHDLVIAKIEDDVDAELDLKPFVRLRTPEQLADNDPPYAPTNISAPTEKHWKATIQIKKGTPALTPVLPTLASGEIALYRMMISPNATELLTGDVLDLRNIAQTVRQLHASDAITRTDISAIYTRLVELEGIGQLLINIGGDVRTLEELLAEIFNRTASSADLPEVRYEIPKYLLHDKRSAMIDATADMVSGTSVIDFPLGLKVNFGDAEVALTPEKIDPAWNPRFITTSGAPAGHVKREIDLNPETVTDLGSDSTPGFSSRLTSVTPARYHAATAARDGRYIEIFGGVNNLSAAMLSDWQTYDTENDTIVTRVVTGDALPATRYPVMFPCGDGEHVLVVCADHLTTARWFKCKVDGTNVVSEEMLTGDVPVGTFFMGDIIRSGVIFITGVTDGGDDNYYAFHVEDEEFNALGVTVPTSLTENGWVVGSGNGFAGCYYAEDKFVFVIAHGPNNYRTYLYDYALSSIVQLTGIGAPYDGQYTNQANWGTGFRLSNVNGKPLLIGGNVSGPGNEGGSPDTSYAWELKTERSSLDKIVRTYWSKIVIAMPVRYTTSFRSLMSSGRAVGKAFSIGGRGMQVSDTQPIIYGSSQTGLIVGTYNGTDGITLGANASFGSFEIPAYVTASTIAGYFIGLRGRYSNETVKIEASFDGGDNWHVLTANQTALVEDSSDPCDRRLRITLYRNGTTTPIITHITEIFDDTGDTDLETNTVIRLDTPEDDNFYAMYMNRLGNVTFLNTGSNQLLPSSPTRCLLMLIIATAGDDATLTPLINRRRPIESVVAVKNASATEDVYSSLAVPVRFFEVRGIVASGKHLYRPTQTMVSTANFRTLARIAKTEVPENDSYEVVFYG